MAFESYPEMQRANHRQDFVSRRTGRQRWRRISAVENRGSVRQKAKKLVLLLARFWNLCPARACARWFSPSRRWGQGVTIYVVGAQTQVVAAIRQYGLSPQCGHAGQLRCGGD